MDFSSNGAHAKGDGTGVMVQAEHLASAVKDGVVHAGESVSATANSAVASVGGTMSGMANSIRQHTPAAVAPYTEKATAGLQHAGEYLQHGSIGGMAEDLTQVVRRHPVPSLLIGATLGFLLGRKLRG